MLKMWTNGHHFMRLRTGARKKLANYWLIMALTLHLGIMWYVNELLVIFASSCSNTGAIEMTYTGPLGRTV